MCTACLNSLKMRGNSEIILNIKFIYLLTVEKMFEMQNSAQFMPQKRVNYPFQKCFKVLNSRQKRVIISLSPFKLYRFGFNLPGQNCPYFILGEPWLLILVIWTWLLMYWFI